MSLREEILSVGIDIGTSTTQLVFSRLTIENRASAHSVPRLDIVEKTVEYRSAVYDTPLLSADLIDAEGVKKIVRAEYEKANKQPQDVKTGAVIITGETARKENAGAVLSALSDMAGDFVVASAGPELESVLAARGAGADILSGERRKTVANLDVGGGTTNIGVYSNGTLAGVCCLDIGGRLIKVENGIISYVFPKIAKLAEKNGISVKVGDDASEKTLRPICALMADELAQALGCKTRDVDHCDYYTNSGKPLMMYPDIDILTFSGGVADFVYNTPSSDYFRFGDIGPLLGEELGRNLLLSRLELCKPRETIRATVVGAGTHTTKISGSTIAYDRACLPIKNVPVLRVNSENDIAQLSSGIKERLELFGKDAGQIAIALSGNSYVGFKQVQALAEAISLGAQSIIESPLPLLIVLEKDIAKALGNALRLRLPNKPVICIDSISAHDGDYIDVGEPVAGGTVLPVVVKTLIFNSQVLGGDGE